MEQPRASEGSSPGLRREEGSQPLSLSTRASGSAEKVSAGQGHALSLARRGQQPPQGL